MVSNTADIQPVAAAAMVESTSNLDCFVPSMSVLNAKEHRPFKPLLNTLRNSFGYSTEESDDSLSDDSEDPSSSSWPSKASLPQCWGHRGASAAYPENTLASFEQAILDGAEGIESDVHVSLDGTIVMFHDAYLNRTTNGKGLISKQSYKDGIDSLRTIKLPAQRICTFGETLKLLMQPGNRHVVLNVDVKLDNDPEILFELMHNAIKDIDDWQVELAPRLILGLWHCKYVEPAQRLLPYCRLAHIGISPSLARKYFWEACSAFSLNYATLVGKEGAEFRAACKVAKKDLYVWTVNDRREMIQATKWGVKAILTDKTADFLSLRDQMSKDWKSVAKEVDWSHAWTNLYYFSPVNTIYMAWETFLMQRTAGPMALPSASLPVSLKSAPTMTPLPASASKTSVQ